LNRYQEAIEALDLAISRNPEPYIWWNGKGIALAKLKRYDEAIAMYDQALERCSDSEVWYNKGISLMMLGRYGAAFGAFAIALEKNPEYPQAWNNKSCIFRELD